MLVYLFSWFHLSCPTLLDNHSLSHFSDISKLLSNFIGQNVFLTSVQVFDIISSGDMMNKLKQLRSEFDYTLRDLEIAIDIPRSNLNLIELGKLFTKNVEKIYEICEFFQVSFDYFWGKSNEGIYVIYGDKTYALNEANFLKYKEAGYITYKEKKRVLTLPQNLDIKFVNSNLSLIEITDKKG